jgi:hypothetical protein
VLAPGDNNWKSQLKRQRLDVRVLAFGLKPQQLKILAFMDSNWSPELKHQHLDVRALAHSPRCLLKTATAFMRHPLSNNFAEALVFRDRRQGAHLRRLNQQYKQQLRRS